MIPKSPKEQLQRKPRDHRQQGKPKETADHAIFLHRMTV